MTRDNNETDREEDMQCSNCGSENVESEISGDFEDWRCQDCGVIVGGGRLVSDANPEGG